MKKILVIFLVFLGLHLISQTNCQNAAPFCASGVSGVTFPATTSITAAQPGPNYGCLNTTPNPAWYYLQISTSGNLDILIEGQVSTPPPAIPGQDVDFICWGPFSSLANICNSLTAGNTVDCSYSGSFTETLNIPNGVAGEYYMVLITNFANINQDIIFSQFGGTGTTNCAILSKSKICAGTSTMVVATNPASLTAPSYTLIPGNITNTTGSFVVSPSVTTSYTVYLNGLNSLSFPVTQTAVSSVSVYPMPSVAPTVTNSSCTSSLSAFNLNLTFFPASPPPGYMVNWASIPPGITTPVETSVTAHMPLGGVFAATVTAAGGCTVPVIFTITPQPDPAIITLSPIGSSHTITCYQPTIEITSLVATNNYTWSNGIIAPRTGTVSAFTSTATGSWTISALNPVSGCVSSEVFVIGQNVSAPSSVISPTFQNITCNITSITTVTGSATPSVNVTHQIMAPQGGTFTANSHLFSYFPGGIGTFTHCVMNDANGCSTCKTFTVTSNQGFPTYSVLSPENFTLGCGTRSVATLNIVNASATPSGAAVSYTIIGPPTSVNTPTGALSTISNYTVNVPGTWTVITKDNTSFCETRTPISILQNTFAPSISAIVPRQILDCAVPKTTLKAQSLNSNVNYLWNLPTNPSTQLGDTLAVSVNSAAVNNSVVANYTLVITDNSSTCKSTSVITIYQNIYPPKAAISNGGISAITCLTSTITLTNNSKTGIPTNTLFPSPLPVIGYIWDGPTPQTQGQVSSTYLAGAVGEYTMTAKDLNNGCTSYAYTTITDNRIYPSVNKPEAPPAFILDCGAKSVKISAIINNQMPGFSYQWLSVPGATISGENTATLTTNTIGNYKIITTNSLNGCSSSGEIKVIDGKLTADFSVVPEQGFAPLPVTFYNNSASTLGPADINAVWSFGNGTHSTTTISNLSPEMVYTQPGTYSVTLFVNKGSCMDTLVKVIRVDIPSVLEIPNVFTPNGDGVNDFFFLKTANVENLSIMIFDRWGHTVYSLKSDKGLIEWDGKNQTGVEAAEGTYFYTLKATGKDGQAYDKKGTITLIR